MNEQHLQQFLEFVEFEKAAGGPDPHMALAVEHVKDMPEADRWWMGGCYVGVYNFPTAARIHAEVPWETALEWDSSEWLAWLTEHWPGIATRRERRAVRSPEKLARYFAEYVEFAEAHLSWGDALWGASRDANYEQLWAEAGRVYALGRYASIKLLEFLRRSLNAPLEQPDFRLDDGWSPVEGLKLLYSGDGNGGPEYHKTLEWAEAKAREVRFLAGLRGFPLTMFETQVFLCDYKQAWNGRQYPGRSQDSELEYAAAIAPHWGADDTMVQLRDRLFPRQVLGEHGGWAHVRKELGKVLPEAGFTWTDFRFDYAETLRQGRSVQDPVTR
jgi:hypothetical protein